MSIQVTIVGAGPGGLASAILLATAGARVRVLERLPVVGGRTSRIDAEGFKFDVGPTFFLYPLVLDKIFRAAGTSLQNEVELIRLDPQYRLQFGAGGQIDATPNLDEMERQILALAPADAGGFRRFMAENRVKFNRAAPCLEESFLGWKDLLRLSLVRMLPSLHPHQSVDGYLKRFFADPRVRVAFSFQSKYLGMSPFRCPSLFTILSFLEFEYGVWHPKGGCAALSLAMARVAERLGVEICLNEGVEALEFEGRKIKSVRTASRTHTTDALVINADFAHAMTKLVPDHLRSGWTNRDLKKKKFSCSTFMLYLGIEGRFDDLPHHLIHISEGYERNLDEIEIDKVVPTDPSFYVQNASVTDSTLAPAGMSTLYMLAPVPHQSDKVDWNKERDRFRRVLLAKAAQAGYKDVASRIRYEKVVTPHEWEHDLAIHKGATFNLSHTISQMLHKRPNNRMGSMEGVYLVGGGTHPGSGLPTIYEGARITSRLLCEEFGLQPPEGLAQKPLSTPAAGQGTPVSDELMAAAQQWAESRSA